MRESSRVDVRNAIEARLYDPITGVLTHFGRQMLENALDNTVGGGKIKDVDNGGQIFTGEMVITQEFNFLLPNRNKSEG